MGFAPHHRLSKVLNRRWNELLAFYNYKKPLENFVPPPNDLVTQPLVDCGSAWRSSFKTIDLEQSQDEISAQLICPYPPGIPFIIPGEKLRPSFVNWLIKQRSLWLNQIPSKIRDVSF